MERPWWRHPCGDADRQAGGSHGAEIKEVLGLEARDDDRTRRHPEHATDLGRGVAGARTARSVPRRSVAGAGGVAAIPTRSPSPNSPARSRSSAITTSPITRSSEPETSAPAEVLADEHDEPDEPISPVTTNGVVDHQDAEAVAVDEFARMSTTPTPTLRRRRRPVTRLEQPTPSTRRRRRHDARRRNDEYADAVSDYAAHIEQRETDVDLPFFAPPRRSSHAPRRSTPTRWAPSR